MDTKGTIKVSSQEIEKQKDIMNLIKEKNIGKLLKYSIVTFGCQMNENDSERLAGMLSEMGYIESEESTDSDLIIFNTCCVRENAELKFYGHLGALKNHKLKNPDMVIAICGCMMQQENVVETIRKKYRQVDIIFGTHNVYMFPELLLKSFKLNKAIIDIWDSTGLIAENMPILRKDDVKAWVTIMYGCNNFCTYCIVPYVRGRERSRSINDIIEEIKQLSLAGIKEVTLLGQNVNSYGKDFEIQVSFAQLLEEVNKIDGIERIRFLTSHPKDLSDELIFAIRDFKKVCKHIHLPVQSGSTKVLREMNRKYTKEQYLDLVKKIKQIIPIISISTDIIVGFPGESEEDFEETIDLVKKARFDSAFTYLYSKRTGTPAAKSEYHIEANVKKDRLLRLENVQNKINKEINDALLGEQVEVLVEGPSKNSLDFYTGRTDSNKVVNFKSNHSEVGQIIDLKIDKVNTWSLIASRENK